MSKRLFDWFFAGVGLLILSPVLLVLAVIIKLDDGGAVFFRQERIGRYGQPFRIWKLRTMSAKSTGGLITVGDDMRITRAGKWIRKFKLDELPQLINVFFGQMSFVGPRPEVEHYVRLYPKVVYDKVLSVLPGITDQASIEFSNESDLLAGSEDPERLYVEKILPRKLMLYQQYVDRRNLLLDIAIIFKTIGKVFGGNPHLSEKR